RTSKGFSAEYAFHIPSRKRLPLVLHIVNGTAMTPHQYLGPERPFTSYAAYVDPKAAIHCAIQLRAHNVENPNSTTPDVANYLRLVERDSKAVVEILDELDGLVKYRRDAVVIAGATYAAEVALAVATRYPKRFTALICRDINFIVGGLASVPKDHRAAYLPILLAQHDDKGAYGEDDGATERKTEERLRGRGFRRIDHWKGDRQGFITQPQVEWFFRQVKAVAKRKKLIAQRDALLAKARAAKGLAAQLRHYRAAVKFEKKRELDAASEALYQELEARGREWLAAGRQKEVLRLFKDLPLEAEAKK
ncbi:MAG: hypothetical protein OER88_09945, partial [Planctomycetota bacterium]|nr:hypothetical protein [Planctomycetota bacterium]